MTAHKDSQGIDQDLKNETPIVIQETIVEETIVVNETVTAQTEGLVVAPQKVLGKDDVMIVYIALGSIVVTGFVGWIVAVIYAYMRKDDLKDTIYYSHMSYLLRTAWWLFWTFIIGLVLSLVLVGFVILGLNFIWYVYRIIKGYLYYKDDKPI